MWRSIHNLSKSYEIEVVNATMLGPRGPLVSPSMMPSQSAVPSTTTMPTNMERRVLAEEELQRAS